MPEIIERYLDDENLDRVERDFRYLMSAKERYFGELELAFRKGRLSLYYRGNSLATISFRPDGMYRIETHRRFLTFLDEATQAPFEKAGEYRRVEVDAAGAHRLLQRENIDKLMKAIRDVNHSEETTFEQILITDNPPSPGFLLIDRQVRDLHLRRQLDLLGLRRLENGRYGFVVLEVKMGNNKELSGDVAEQLKCYVDHIRKPEHGRAWARCYEKNYRQKRRLGWIEDPMPVEIEIDGAQVEGLVVVGGYSRQAGIQVALLKAAHPDLMVHVFGNALLDERGRLVGE